jgi:hypothetical protein
MSLSNNSKLKIRNIQRTIDSIANGDLPFVSGKRALQRLQAIFEALDDKLDRAIKLKDAENIASQASNINLKILQILPILGFILRSTNVRNAFELIEPLQTVARAAMQGKPELILSSEWDYIPFAYPQSLEDLRSYVLIGLPASEAASALLVPIAAHELGHAVWRNRALHSDFQATLDQRLQKQYQANIAEFQKVFRDYDEKDVFRREILQDAVSDSLEFAELQAEELFCDLFAYALFGASYLQAFAFILAPGSSGYRSGKYPTYSSRIGAITTVAKGEGLILPDHLQLSFGRDQRGVDDRHRFAVRMADECISTIVPEIWQKVLQVINTANLVRPVQANAVRHVEDLKLGIPPSITECLGDILNAGWLRYEEIMRSARNTNQASDEIDRLNELLLKTIEVSEFRRRTK